MTTPEPPSSPSPSPTPVAPTPTAQAPLPPEPARSSARGCFFAAAALALLVVVAVIVFMIGVFGAARSMTGSGQTFSIASGSVLEIPLSGPLSQAPPTVELGPLFGGNPPSLWGVRRALLEAAEDNDISAVLLRISGAGLGWATAEEILGLLDDFRETGKPVHALLRSDMISDLDYFLATGADRIWVTPYAGVLVNGLASQPQFYRGSLDKLRIEPQVIMFKEYKSAGESYNNYEMSPYFRESIEGLLETFSGRFSERVTARRGVSAAALEEFLAKGVTSTADMKASGLVDERGFLDQVHDALSDEIDSRYEGVGLDDYLRSLGPESRSGRDRIAVVFGEGQIVTQAVEGPSLPFFGSVGFSGPIVARNIREAAEDSRTRAIVFRVDSPGGAVVGSNLVLHEIQRAQANGIPVIISMADYAASGGYWVSMSADAIVAQPSTVTGSIGVVFTKFNLDGFYEWLGTNTATVTTDENATIFAFTAWDEDDREAVVRWMDSSYSGFTEGVAEGRGMPLEKVQKIAKGRVWSGIQALGNGLVDELGGFDRAVEIAVEKAGIDGRPSLVVYPRPKTFFEQVMDAQMVAAPVAALRDTPLSLEGLVEFVEGFAEPRVEARAPDLNIR